MFYIFDRFLDFIITYFKSKSQPELIPAQVSKLVQLEQHHTKYSPSNQNMQGMNSLIKDNKVAMTTIMISKVFIAAASEIIQALASTVPTVTGCKASCKTRRHFCL